MKKKKKINEIIFSLAGYDSKTQKNDQNKINEILYQVVSESSQAIRFITIIEDEFNIELDDDDIDIAFFESTGKMAEIIKKYLI